MAEWGAYIIHRSEGVAYLSRTGMGIIQQLSMLILYKWLEFLEVRIPESKALLKRIILTSLYLTWRHVRKNCYKNKTSKSCMKLQKMPCWLSLQKDYLLLALEKRLLWYLNVFSDEIKSSSTVEIFFKEIRKWWPTDCDCHICRTYISKIGYIT